MNKAEEGVQDDAWTETIDLLVKSFDMDEDEAHHLRESNDFSIEYSRGRLTLQTVKDGKTSMRTSKPWSPKR